MPVKFAPNRPVTLAFPFGDYKEVESQYGGMQYLYTVEIDGQRDYLYAAPGLHEHLGAQGDLKGALLTITKQVGSDGKFQAWTVVPGEDAAAPAPVAKPANGRQATQDAPGRESASPAATERTAPSTPTLDDLVALMDACWRKAAEIAGSLPEDLVSADTVQAVGVSLFIEARRHRIDALPADEPVYEPRELAANEVQHPAQAARERIAQQKRVARAFDADDNVPLPEPGPEADAAQDDLPF